MFFTAKERKDAGFAVTRKEVMGTDCFLPFGFCCLSLKAPKEPLATPEGYIYDKESIYESLLKQKIELQAAQKKYEEQERRKAKQNQTIEQEAKEIAEFTKIEKTLLSEDARHKRALERVNAEDDDSRPEKKLRKGEMLVIDKSKMRENVFWAKETTPTAAPTEVKKVDMTTKCPMTGKKLRLKDLYSIDFEIADQKLVDQGGGKGMYCCAVSKTPIIHQQALLIKSTGVVILESVYNDIVSKDNVCPVTGKKLKGKEDMIKLQMGGTGFSAHNEVEAKSFAHIRSRFGDDRTQAGHLPKAGYVGLH